MPTRVPEIAVATCLAIGYSSALHPCRDGRGRRPELVELRQALEIFQRIGAPEATDVSGELGALIKAGPTG